MPIALRSRIDDTDKADRCGNQSRSESANTKMCTVYPSSRDTQCGLNLRKTQSSLNTSKQNIGEPIATKSLRLIGGFDRCCEDRIVKKDKNNSRFGIATKSICGLIDPTMSVYTFAAARIMRNMRARGGAVDSPQPKSKETRFNDIVEVASQSSKDSRISCTVVSEDRVVAKCITKNEPTSTTTTATCISNREVDDETATKPPVTTETSCDILYPPTDPTTKKSDCSCNKIDAPPPQLPPPEQYSRKKQSSFFNCCRRGPIIVVESDEFDSYETQNDRQKIRREQRRRRRQGQTRMREQRPTTSSRSTDNEIDWCACFGSMCTSSEDQKPQPPPPPKTTCTSTQSVNEVECQRDCNKVSKLLLQMTALEREIARQKIESDQIKILQNKIDNLQCSFDAMKQEYAERKNERSASLYNNDPIQTEQKSQSQCCKATSTTSIKSVYMPPQSSNVCQNCRNICGCRGLVTSNLECVVLQQLDDEHQPNDVALTVLMLPDNKYHINVTSIKTGRSLGCIYATDEAITEAQQANLFSRMLTFFVIDSLCSVDQKKRCTGFTFEMVYCDRETGGEIITKQRKKNNDEENDTTETETETSTDEDDEEEEDEDESESTEYETDCSSENSSYYISESKSETDDTLSAGSN